MSRSLALFLSALALVLSASNSGRANEEVRPTLAQAAKIIKQLLDQRGANAVTVGEFAGPPQFAAATGTGMRKILIEELAKLDVRDKKLGAAFGVKGQFSPPVDQGMMRIKISLVDAQGEPLTQLNADVETKPEPVPNDDFIAPPLLDALKTQVRNGEFDLTNFGSPTLLAESLGVTMPFSIKRGFIPRTVQGPQEVLKAFENPPAFIENGSQVRADRTSPYFVQILVDGRPRNAVLEEGHPFVELDKGESFQIRVVNQAPFDVAAKFHLDGVNTYAFTEMRKPAGPEKGNPLYSRWVVAKGSGLILKGWHRNNQTVDIFLVTDFENSATARAGNSGGQGTIVVTIQSTWRKADQRPPLEERPEEVASDFGTNGATLGSAGSAAGGNRGSRIGFGDRDQQNVRADVNARTYGLPRAVIAIRYTRT